MPAPSRAELSRTVAAAGWESLALVRVLAAILVTLALVPALLFAVAVDGWSGESLDPAFTGRFVAFGLIVGLSAVLLGERKGFLIAPAVFTACMLALPFVDLTAVKPAVRAVHAIRPGMSEAEVRAVLDRHFPESGRFRRPQIGAVHRGRLAFVLDPSDAGLNAALVEVEFSDGQCVRAGFSPD